MLEEIKSNLGNPEELEKLYRSDRKSFKASFDDLYKESPGSDLVKFWRVRLDYGNSAEVFKGISRSEILVVLAICLVTTFFIKLPAIAGLPDNEVFYMKNAALIVFLGVTLYSLWINRITDISKLLMTAAVFTVPAVYLNLLPSTAPSDAVGLVYMHFPFMMLFIYSVIFNRFDFTDPGKRISFIRYLGDLAVFYAMIAIAGMILTVITMGLFKSIGLHVEQFYMENIALSGAVAAPVIASYLIEKFPSLVNRIASLIALIFSPVVLLTLLVFLSTMIITGKDPYNNRDFLFIFNVMLLGVMAIIIFSVSETSVIKFRKFNAIILLLLTIVSIIIDLFALSAIFYRLSAFGLSPNRLAVVVSNILVLVNLGMIMPGLIKINFRGEGFSGVETIIAKYLPVYLVWIVFVVFCFPLIFGVN
jgi:hypothetical protein